MRLFLTGPTGSGKSTLARRIADRFLLPLHALDDMHWESAPDGDRRRDPLDRLAMLEEVVAKESWIVEGVQFKWADPALDRAEIVIVLDPPRWRNVLRILRRHLQRRLSGVAGARGTVYALRQEMRWSGDYYRYERSLLIAKLEPYGEKVRLAKTSEAAFAAVTDQKSTATPLRSQSP